MELIKQIKEAETQAQKIIEQAKTDAANRAEEAQKGRIQTLEQARHERKKSIEVAVAAAQSQGLAEIEKLKAQAEKNRQQLRDKAQNKMAGAVTKVMDYLKG